VLDCVTFRKLLSTAAVERRTKLVQLLSHVPLFESLHEVDLVQLADALETRNYPQGRVIILQVSSLGDAKSSLGDAKSSLGDAKSLLGDAKSFLCDAKGSLGDAKSFLCDAKGSLGDAKSILCDAKSSLGDVYRTTPPRRAFTSSSQGTCLCAWSSPPARYCLCSLHCASRTATASLAHTRTAAGSPSWLIFSEAKDPLKIRHFLPGACAPQPRRLLPCQTRRIDSGTCARIDSRSSTSSSDIGHASDTAPALN
jgi:hypothetical protein